MSKFITKTICITLAIISYAGVISAQKTFANSTVPVKGQSINLTEQTGEKTRAEKVLWNNTNIHQTLDAGYHSVSWTDEEVIQADDFEVMSPWIISKVTVKSFVNGVDGGPAAEYPDNVIIVFYKDDNGKPGAEIYSKTLPGGQSSTGQPATLVLSEPCEINEPGRYWVSVYGKYNSSSADNKIYRLYVGDKEIGECVHLRGKDITGWITPGEYYPGLAAVKSFSFTLIGEAPGACPEVTNLAAEKQGEDVRLTWKAPSEGTPTGYRIYKDGSPEATVQDMFYVLKGVGTGEYVFGVAALFDGEDCDPVNVTISVKINADGFPIKNLSLESTSNCVADLSWEAPDEAPDYEGWISYSTDQITGRLGYQENDPMEMWEISRYTPDDLNTYGVNTGQTITKVSIGLGTDKAKILSYKVCIWQGGTSPTEPGDLLVEQDVTPSSLTEMAMNEIALSVPYEIDASKELWIGCKINNEGGFPMTRDVGPGVNGKGNIVYFNHPQIGWQTIQSAYDVDANFNIKAFIAAQDKKTIILGGGAKVPTRYDIYCDDVNVGNTTELSYQHRLEQDGEHELCVVAVYGEKQSPKVCDIVTVSCDCEPPTNLKIELEDITCDLLLSWDGFGSAYNVYKNDELLAEKVTSPHLVNIELGVEVEFCISTICADQESEKACLDPVKCTGGAINNPLSETLHIYPNPATSTINIVGDNIVKVEVYNVVGQKVEVKTGAITTIDVSAYNNGIYLFRVYDSNNNVATQRIMVSK
ncbi:MAG: T9SS type A sorting domain-containing protein [Bacteroidales bacterium]|nr:T9SS type A sorting domain-containing protein [Bacteroidales bacterium]